MLKLMTLISSSLLFHMIKLLSLVLFFSIATKVTCRLSNETEQLALLSFKELIAEDLLGSLSSWNNSLDLCKWDGVTCSHKHQRVVVLDLRGKNLRGTMSPFLGNLSLLRSLYLQENRFQGKIPLELNRLFKLRRLNCSSNSLRGEIPTNFSNSLEVIELSVNDLDGKIPAFGSLSKLTDLSLSSNHLIGGIPPSLGNLSLLQSVDLRRNSLTGSIPHSIGRIPNLRGFGIGENKLSGIVPPPLYNISTLMQLIIPANQLTGSLPQDIGLTLPNLRFISVGGNQFWGPIPVSLSNASRLEYLDLAGNNLSGPIPFDLGRKMKDLVWLNLGENNLGFGDASDLRFIDSLTNCSKLQKLGLNGNGFGGVLPTSIANLSSHLNLLVAGQNQLVGNIPAGISALVSLAGLGLAENLFSSVIPFEIGKLRKLQVLTFRGNKLSGPIPESIGNLTRIYALDLSENNFNGTIPSSIHENILGLQILYLSNNFLTGPIPNTVGLFSTLTFLYLDQNAFIGVLPLEIEKLNNLEELDVSENKLSGRIPSTLGNCLKLEGLFLEGNTFQGSIPPSLSSLRGIKVLDLSRNNLSGQIPEDLAALIFLKNLNLSFNNLAGEVPLQGVFGNLSKISLVGNKGLCGGIAEMWLPACPMSKKKGNHFVFKIMVPIACVILCLSLVLFFVVFLRKTKQKNKSLAQPFIGDDYLRVSYDQLFKATGGFSSSNLIGAGSFGTVYKGILHEGEKPIAVKVLNLEQRGASKSFVAECEALRNTRHKNLQRIITVCSSINHAGDDFKALVFEYMPNGSLEKWLHPGEDTPQQEWNLSLSQRLNIAIDVACALEYLHHRCETPIVHCDLKPSNVLIDEDKIARVGDFGLAKFLTVNSSKNDGGQTNSLAIKGSIGYVAPEYGIGGRTSKEGDVYSYGILLLEMLTGKRPTHEFFANGQSLREFCMLALPERVMEIVDPRMQLEEPTKVENDAQNEKVRRAKIRECLISLVRIGIACSAESPGQRMNIKDVVIGLTKIKEVFLGVHIHAGRQLRMGLDGEGTSRE